MPNRRLPHPDHIHFAPGFAGTLGWMGYWATSRTANAKRAVQRRWHLRLRPTLVAQTTALMGRTASVLRRSGDAPIARSYESLADAVRQRGWADAQS